MNSPMSNRILVHGVPNTPLIWRPLLDALGGDALAPCLPGFCGPPCDGFSCSKDAYADWLIQLLEERCSRHGPADIFGHDWGALLTLRAAGLRPDLIKSWAISGAAIDAGYRGHVVAHIWNTARLGEAAMAATPRKLIEISIRLGGLPRAMAQEEAAAWTPHMRAAILALYRSANALRLEGPWVDGLAALPKRGLVVWGARDPFVGLPVAIRFARRHGARLHVARDAGHWVIAERAREIAPVLLAHWQRRTRI